MAVGANTAAQVSHGCDNDWISEDNGAEKRAAAGYGVPFAAEEPIDDKGVKDKHDAGERLPQAHRGVVVSATPTGVIERLVAA